MESLPNIESDKGHLVGFIKFIDKDYILNSSKGQIFLNDITYFSENGGPGINDFFEGKTADGQDGYKIIKECSFLKGYDAKVYIAAFTAIYDKDFDKNSRLKNDIKKRIRDSGITKESNASAERPLLIFPVNSFVHAGKDLLRKYLLDYYNMEIDKKSFVYNEKSEGLESFWTGQIRYAEKKSILVSSMSTEELIKANLLQAYLEKDIKFEEQKEFRIGVTIQKQSESMPNNGFNISFHPKSWKYEKDNKKWEIRKDLESICLNDFE